MAVPPGTAFFGESEEAVFVLVMPVVIPLRWGAFAPLTPRVSRAVLVRVCVGGQHEYDCDYCLRHELVLQWFVVSCPVA